MTGLTGAPEGGAESGGAAGAVAPGQVQPADGAGEPQDSAPAAQGASAGEPQGARAADGAGAPQDSGRATGSAGASEPTSGVAASPAAQTGSTSADERQSGAGLRWRSLLKRLLAVLVSGLTFYLFLPVLLKVFHAWPRLSTLRPIWLIAMAVAEIAAFTCTFALKRIALRTKSWFPVVTAALCGNAVTNVFPGSDATGAAVEFRLLAGAGIDAGDAVGGLTATGMLQTAALLALPVLELPAVLLGIPLRPGLVHLVYLGLVAFVLYMIGIILLLRCDRPIELAARAVQWLRNKLVRKGPRLTGLDRVWVQQRDQTRAALGSRWRQAALLSAGRVLCDFGCLFAALAATGARPRPSVVLVAYASTMVVGLLPLTPGGIGIVEGSLTGLLVLAGIPSANAVLATLAYRLFSYWVPILLGPPAYLAYQLRYHPPRWLRSGRHSRGTRLAQAEHS